METRSYQAVFLNKVSDVLCHIEKFEASLQQLDPHWLCSVNNWKFVALNLIEIARNAKIILQSNAQTQRLKMLDGLVSYLDRFVQTAAAFAQATYALISDLKHYYFSLGMIKGLTECERLSMELKINEFCVGFNSKFCSKIYTLSKEVHEMRLDYDYFVSQTTDKFEIKKRGVEILLQIYNYATSMLKVLTEGQYIKNSVISGIIDRVLSILSSHNDYLNRV